MVKVPALKAPFKHFQALGVLMICSSALAQGPAKISDAIKKLRDAANYTWTATVEIPSAPFNSAPITGVTDTNGFVVMKSKVEGKIAVLKGKERLMKTISGWKTASELGSVQDPTDHDLSTARAPADELAMFVRCSDLRSVGENLFTGTLSPTAAKAFLQSAMRARRRAGWEDIQNATGQFQLWLKNGLPQKYTLTLTAEIPLPFSTDVVTYNSSTEIKDIGCTKVEVPEKARQILESTTN